jgi:5-methylcytosine-specific restriction endonuclease McrA
MLLRCSRCKSSKDSSEFYPDPYHVQTGFASYCKECSKKVARASYAKNKIARRAQKTKYHRENAETERLTRVRYVAKNPEKIRNFQCQYRSAPATRKIYLDSIKRWNRKNPVKLKAYRKSADHKRRMWKKGGSFTASEWLALCNLYGNRCLGCGDCCSLTADHVVPLKLGGRNTIDNIQPLCLRCNVKKGIKIIDFRNGKGNRHGED